MRPILGVTGFAVLLGCSSAVNSESADPDNGQVLYKTYCEACHGSNGKLRLNNAADLALSEMTLEERIKNISEGGNTMPAFNSVISVQQIEAVAVYLDELKERN